ncbi:MAG: alpha/beta hydrolase [Mycobacteriales bacterium]
MTSQLIRGTTILPADRRPVTLHTADGLALVGELARPEHLPARATMVCLHPLPTHGGMMDSHLFRKAAYRLPATAQIAVLRFNTRGTGSDAGTSEGTFDEGNAERHDLAAAVDFVATEGLPAPWLVGWSFGADLALRHGLLGDVVGAVLVSPPLRSATDADLDRWADDGRPLTAVVPELDDYLRPPEARHRFARVPQAEVVEIAGGKHLLVGRTETVHDEIVKRVRPEACPLAREWPAARPVG